MRWARGACCAGAGETALGAREKLLKRHHAPPFALPSLDCAAAANREGARKGRESVLGEMRGAMGACRGRRWRKLQGAHGAASQEAVRTALAACEKGRKGKGRRRGGGRRESCGARAGRRAARRAAQKSAAQAQINCRGARAWQLLSKGRCGNGEGDVTHRTGFGPSTPRARSPPRRWGT